VKCPNLVQILDANLPMI